jgi:hypothetical protein
MFGKLYPFLLLPGVPLLYCSKSINRKANFVQRFERFEGFEGYRGRSKRYSIIVFNLNICDFFISIITRNNWEKACLEDLES